jgi:hypothetical protein
VMSRMTSYAMEINYQGVLLRLVLKHWTFVRSLHVRQGRLAKNIVIRSRIIFGCRVQDVAWVRYRRAGSSPYLALSAGTANWNVNLASSNASRLSTYSTVPSELINPSRYRGTSSSAENGTVVKIVLPTA